MTPVIIVGLAMALTILLVVAPQTIRNRKARQAFIAIFGLEQVRGMTLEQARFAAKTGLISPIIPHEEAMKILDGLL